MRLIVRVGMFAFMLRIFRRCLYLSVSIGFRLHSCFTRPVRMVVRARLPVPGSFSRSAMTNWFATSSLRISSSYSSPGSFGFSAGGGRMSTIFGVLPVASHFIWWYTRIVARCMFSASMLDQSSIRCRGIYALSNRGKVSG